MSLRNRALHFALAPRAKFNSPPIGNSKPIALTERDLQRFVYAIPAAAARRSGQCRFAYKQCSEFIAWEVSDYFEPISVCAGTPEPMPTKAAATRSKWRCGGA